MGALLLGRCRACSPGYTPCPGRPESLPGVLSLTACCETPIEVVTGENQCENLPLCLSGGSEHIPCQGELPVRDPMPRLSVVSAQPATMGGECAGRWWQRSRVSSSAVCG